MINPDVFTQQMSLLEEWSGRTLSEPMFDVFQESLNPHLTTEEFIGAVKRIIREEIPYGFPPIVSILKKAGKTADQKAAIEWGLIMTHEYNSYEHSLPDGLSRIGYAALKRVGGIRAVKHTDGYQLGACQKIFTEAYEQYFANPEQADLDPETAYESLPGSAHLPPALPPVGVSYENEPPASPETMRRYREKLNELVNRHRFSPDDQPE